MSIPAGMPSRRGMLAGGLALPFAGPVPASAATLPPIADMHFHSYFGNSIHHARPLAQSLAAGGVTLAAWSLVGDLLWVDWKTYRQRTAPTPAEAMGWFEREMARIKSHIAEQRLKVVLTAADVDRAVAGEPHVVLAVEGATFITEPRHVAVAYEAGVRHLQLVHFSANPLGDIQTESASHNGITGLGREVMAECNRLGMLVDLAHCAPATVRGALAVAKAPVVWSHGSVTRGAAPSPAAVIWRARQLALDDARAIAAAGGVVGLWGLTLDVGLGIEAYARRVLQMADWLGDAHVAFGTDINGLGPNALIRDYAGLRRVVEIWQHDGVAADRITRLAIGNYARVLKAVFSARRV